MGQLDGFNLLEITVKYRKQYFDLDLILISHTDSRFSLALQLNVKKRQGTY